MMAIFPTSLLCLFFRRIETPTTRTKKVKRLLIENVNGLEFSEINKNNSKLVFPWCFKIIAYLTSFTLMSISITITLIKGKF